MASRKFKDSWIPTPLRGADITISGVDDIQEEAELPPTSPDEPLPGVALATAAGSRLTSLAKSAQSTVADSALGSAAGSALAAAQQSVRETVVNSALFSAATSAASSATSAASSAFAAARASTAASMLAAAMGPIPSPVALVNRASFIIKFFLRTMFREVFLGIWNSIGRKRERRFKWAHDTRAFAESLGGSWITLVRLAAMREDLLGVEYCRELARTRDQSAPVAFELIHKTVDEDLRGRGTSFEEVFSEFDEQPLVVRSFGQAHRARLRGSNHEVIVRVRAPDAVQRAKTDQRYLGILLFLLEQFEIEPHMRWSDLFFEVKKSTDDLLDFRTEVEELRRVAKILRKRRIYVPVLYRRYCTERILVVEHITGVDVEDLLRVTHENPSRCDAWMSENNIDHRRIWRRLFNVHNEMVFEHNLFYSELLPSSIVLLRDNRMAFVSFGTLATIDADLHDKYRQLYRALLDSDYTKVCDIYLTMGPPLPYKDISNMKQAAIRALRTWEARTHVKQVPYSAKSLAAAMSILARCASDQELPAFWNLARLQAAEQILTRSLQFFDPTKGSIKSLKQYERSAQLRIIKQVATKGVRKRVNGFTDAAQLNMQLLENFQHDGEYLRRRLMGVQAKLSKISAILGRLVMIVAKLALVALALQVFLHFTGGKKLHLPFLEEGPVARVLAAVRPRTTVAWIVVLAVLFYMRRFLINLARQLFAKEVSPREVA